MKSLQTAGGPFFEDLEIGMSADDAPSVTLTSGLAAQHQTIVGDRMRLALDQELAEAVTGGPMAHPALAWDVVIGQSTLFTRRVIANLFYRGLAFRRFPNIGDTLHTTTEVVGLKQNRGRPGRPATGLGVLRIRSVDQAGHEVLDFRRCAMFPLRDPMGKTPHQAEIDSVSSDLDSGPLKTPISGWRLAEFKRRAPGLHFDDLTEGTIWEIAGGDVVSSAPELARLTLNLAMVHHDAAASPAGRLVYGGHTIGIAAAQAARALFNLAAIIGWHGCDHLGPVREGDTLRSTLALEKREPFAQGGGFVHLRSRVKAERGGESHDVLDWRFVGVMA
jgi:acyl dehydratase